MRLCHRLLVLISLGSGLLRAEEAAPVKAAELIPPYAYCVGYVLRDPVEGDIHGKAVEVAADAPKTEAKPENPQGLGRPANGILQEGEPLVNVAALTALTTAQVRLTPEQAKRVLTAASTDGKRFPVMEAYEPHHAFVFYSEQGQPLGCVELSLSCNAVKLGPQPGAASQSLSRFDLKSMATLVAELKLPLTPYKALKDFDKDKQEELKFAAKVKEEQKKELNRMKKELEKKAKDDPEAAKELEGVREKIELLEKK
ncbi:hypothetical protein [Luteolibacter luteus]|uniref:DUF1682 domain-containing protein n=1 Tax=Luteolibacter luteus TaxID=2728835 RepID=A0A858RM76_9BACT|nr:hypothetical protein [Luteolibacter luteus]QJE97825.1 DUF1682 domain-containing protein [Luteolibacter luteus]